MNICPRCNREIDESRVFEPVLICDHCGWVKETRSQKKLDIKSWKSQVMVLSVLSVLLIASLFYIRKWDNHSVEVLSLQIKETFVGLDADSYKKLIEICQERGSAQCMVDTSKRWQNVDRDNLEALKHFGDSLRLNSERSRAIDIYQTYLRLGGVDLKAKYHLANLLAIEGHRELSIQNFEQLLKARPDILQVTVLKRYIDYLVKWNMGERAIKLIRETQEKGVNARLFMKKELEKLEKSRNPS